MWAVASITTPVCETLLANAGARAAPAQTPLGRARGPSARAGAPRPGACPACSSGLSPHCCTSACPARPRALWGCPWAAALCLQGQGRCHSPCAAHQQQLRPGRFSLRHRASTAARVGSWVQRRMVLALLGAAEGPVPAENQAGQCLGQVHVGQLGSAKAV